MTAPPRRELREELVHTLIEADNECHSYEAMADYIMPLITRELAAARKEERERCAGVLVEHYARHDNRETGYHEGARDALDIAEQAIRALGDE